MDDKQGKRILFLFPRRDYLYMKRNGKYCNINLIFILFHIPVVKMSAFMIFSYDPKTLNPFCGDNKKKWINKSKLDKSG